MGEWTTFFHAGEFSFDGASTRDAWHRLHLADLEPLPDDDAVLNAWALFHAGQFQRAREAGLKAGGAGLAVANKATAIYANYLEPRESTRLALFKDVAERAESQIQANPDNYSAWYWRAYALGRYSQGISVAKALAQGLGARVKQSLERVIELAPAHADAHIALGTFHAEVIDKVGALIGGMTYGAKKEVGLRMFQQALKLHPGSLIGRVEYANALVMLDGDAKMHEATRLYEQAAAATPIDATERLDVEMAQTELAS
jgi:tetratricopeptide (TPR) repeat protein